MKGSVVTEGILTELQTKRWMHWPRRLNNPKRTQPFPPHAVFVSTHGNKGRYTGFSVHLPFLYGSMCGRRKGARGVCFEKP